MVCFLNAKLDINLNSFPNDDIHDSYAEKASSRHYVIYLTEDWDIPVLIHELWHIFMDCLTNFDDGVILPQDLEKDIYAYSFEKLLRDSLKEIEMIGQDEIH